MWPRVVWGRITGDELRRIWFFESQLKLSDKGESIFVRFRKVPLGRKKIIFPLFPRTWSEIRQKIFIQLFVLILLLFCSLIQPRHLSLRKLYVISWFLDFLLVIPRFNSTSSKPPKSKKTQRKECNLCRLLSFPQFSVISEDFSTEDEFSLVFAEATQNSFQSFLLRSEIFNIIKLTFSAPFRLTFFLLFLFRRVEEEKVLFPS